MDRTRFELFCFLTELVKTKDICGQVLTAAEFYTCRRNQAVKLRKDEHGLGAEQPISVPTLLQEVSDTYPSVTAIKARDKLSGEWKLWTYQHLQEEVTVRKL